MKLSHKEITRIKETLEMIPSDVVSILEVGCGDGRITNSICHKHKLTGIDIDKERIKSFRGEIYRVTKKYILITVPFEEVLPAQWLKCSKCGHIFHAWGHLRRFDLRMLKTYLNIHT
ncbi:hypothetical protein DMNBHIDG_00502 [Candidatus Methanoperedenaceae archaeon GB37]|nr:hypothetical protein DMNBHIDG_00502 [Candidatus Methanoperedenaceae archaeon GB37]